MFIGEFQHNLDEKGRLAIPAKFRADLKKGAVVTKGLDNCLFLYTKDAWEELITSKLSRLSFNKANQRAFARFMLSGASEVEFDAQGRIVLPEYLRHFADLHKQVVIAGLYDRLEIWDKDRWEAYRADNDQASSSIAESLDNLL
ncbi:MAG TPA: division/cell wall cluster transcriptional repressor MraZ [bacterium]|jgi:MraZ protein|nr:division/cell wall cluster transcriptional repressor MraZ [bacterium]HOE80950.1 division/cell wall cluster transcriptional repressor MraZ [bacterium]HOR69277.1 division/cell wall cluster transcriptional repressor MraZ [bacterium]HOS99126.1 division/cell wall cluster transcriptional repressor MraZ [bacterium]HPL83421.1 division/cell wall cluster transcriptional repressor MraZ [bacterium]